MLVASAMGAAADAADVLAAAGEEVEAVDEAPATARGEAEEHADEMAELERALDRGLL